MKVLDDTIAVAYVHPGTVTEAFSRSLAELCLRNHENKIIAIISSSSPRQEVARNKSIEKFLEGTVMPNGDVVGAEWLMWIDTDMVFQSDACSKLRETARKTNADMVGGLAFVYKRGSNELTTNGWMWNPDIQHWEDIADYESGEVREIDGTGAAFILINRRVLSRLEKDWHVSGIHPDTGNYMGHDLAFCYDAVVKGGAKLVWDTGVATGHVKWFQLDENMYRNYQESSK